MKEENNQLRNSIGALSQIIPEKKTFIKKKIAIATSG